MSSTGSPGFLRARKPAEREVRREAILSAAASLFDAEGVQGTGLNAIAAKAGFSKSNIYRYFENREEVLLSLMIESFDDLTEALATEMATLAIGDMAGLARLTTDGFLRRPRLGQLMAILSTILEATLSEERIVALKRELPEQLKPRRVDITTTAPSAPAIEGDKAA